MGNIFTLDVHPIWLSDSKIIMLAKIDRQNLFDLGTLFILKTLQKKLTRLRGSGF